MASVKISILSMHFIECVFVCTSLRIITTITRIWRLAGNMARMWKR